MAQTKDQLKDLLQQKVVKVVFNKINGTERTMTCTLMKNLLPVNEQKNTVKIKKENENVLSVWDLEKEAFRSFRIDSLTDYSIIQEGYEL